MKSSTKILIGVGAVAAVAMAYHFYSQRNKSKEVAGTKSVTDPTKPDLATPGILPGGEPGAMVIQDHAAPAMEDLKIMAPAGVELPLPAGMVKRPFFPIDPLTGAPKMDAPMMEYSTIDMQTV
jgi:hypothetical protein